MHVLNCAIDLSSTLPSASSGQKIENSKKCVGKPDYTTIFIIKNCDHQADQDEGQMEWRPRKPNLKFQPCRQICPLGPKTSPQTSPCTGHPPSRKGSPCRGEEGNQVYFVRQPFCAWLSGKSAKRMKHEVSFSKHIWIPPYSYKEQYQTSPMKRNPKGTFVVTSNLYSVFPFELYICSSWLLLFCLNILDWMKRGSFCVFHLCTILMGQSGIVKVLVFFETFSM